MSLVHELPRRHDARAEARTRAGPQVYRYRYPNADMALGHTGKSTSTAATSSRSTQTTGSPAASGSAPIALDMKSAFDDNGTPDNFADDKPRGTPLPCRYAAELVGAAVQHRRDGRWTASTASGPGTDDLDVPTWLASARPRSQGVRYLGSVLPPGPRRGWRRDPAFDSQDIDFNHETELTPLRPLPDRHRRARRRRAPAGRRPARAGVDNTKGNGGVHAYRVDRLTTTARRPRPRRPAGLRARPDRRRRRSTARRSAPGRRRPSAPRTCSSRSRARTGSSWAGTRRARRSSTSPRTPNGTIDFKEAGCFIPAEREHVGLAHLQGAGEPERHLHLLGRHGRLQPRRERAQHHRRLQGHAAGAAEAARHEGRRRKAPLAQAAAHHAVHRPLVDVEVLVWVERAVVGIGERPGVDGAEDDLVA